MFYKFKRQNSKGKSMVVLLCRTFNFLFALFTFNFLLLTSPAYAITDPLAVPNNRFGVHIITPIDQEASPAAQMVNNNGDWGYVTVLVESKNRNHDSWQKFFDDLRRRHLIPLVRLATQPEGNYWKRPYEGEEQAIADFLDSLIWPTKNRYIIIYNEPNHATEWGGAVDPISYAHVLNKTIKALKAKSDDFFVLNAGFDASAPQKAPNYFDETYYLKAMNDEIPGIFDKLDGWVSHSYPNPEFIGSPDGTGKGSVRTWKWELDYLKSLGVKKELPIFITETGWRHAEGITYNRFWPNEDTLSQYYKKTFEIAWNDPKIVVVTPFLLNYQEPPFDHFSFKKPDGQKQDTKIAPEGANVLGTQYSPYYAFYQTIKDMPKITGAPIQENKARLLSGEVYNSIVAEESYDITLTFKNTGQSIWGEGEPVKAKAITGAQELSIEPVELPRHIRIEPNQDHTFHFKLKAPIKGTYKVAINLFSGNEQFQSKPVEFTTEVKSPVILKIKANLKWKNNPEGEYTLKAQGITGEKTQPILIEKDGTSEDLIARFLLPNYEFTFTLEKRNYHSESIIQTVQEGENILNFGTLQPDIWHNLFNPQKLWQLLPWSK